MQHTRAALWRLAVCVATDVDFKEEHGGLLLKGLHEEFETKAVPSETN